MLKYITNVLIVQCLLLYQISKFQLTVYNLFNVGIIVVDNLPNDSAT